MLDTETKRRIDTARDILVGKVPDPKSQVEQITIALIYKFMDDMDLESEELGGERSFFKGEFEKYAWRNIFDPRMGGFEILNMYSEAIMKMNVNPNIPQLFRDIFKNAYLPYRDPETLKAFLKIINDFTYDHSEKLGDAFEYLLSVLGSQGEAGQFRTPRHIIDFMVAIIDPKKDEVIMDPACGTAGFLISSYKHIIKQNSSNYDPESDIRTFETKDQNLSELIINSKNYTGDKLTPDERNRLAKNVIGYDISPDMVRLSLVNMYLHGLHAPHIHEYDTLTSEDNWNEYGDVILANPPFMSPKGGIRPHKRFSITSNRSEVLFVDYIAEHLTPNGRAAVIVPEGIIFQSGKAYKNLRKMLVEEYLVGVISLPAGVFQPYSGVKTSILWLDRTLAKKADKILFVKVDNDGFDLGAQRRPIKLNDLPGSIIDINEYKQFVIGERSQQSYRESALFLVSRNKILTSTDMSLSQERYKESNRIVKGRFKFAEIGSICSFEYGKPLKKEDRKDGEFPVYGSNGIVDLHNSYLVKAPFLVIGRKGTAGAVHFAEKNGYPIDTTFYVKLDSEKEVLLKYLYHTLSFANLDEVNVQSGIPGLNRNDAYKIQIPLPPLSVQKEIVDEIESYQRIIDGARQVVENYKPRIDIDPNWDMVELGEVCKIKSGGTPSKSNSEFWEGPIPWVSPKDMKNDFIYDSQDHVSDYAIKKSSAKLVPENTILCVVRSGILKHSFPIALTKVEVCYNQDIISIIGIEKLIDNRFIFYYLKSQSTSLLKNGIKTGVTVQSFRKRFFNELLIPLPPIATQKEIVEKLELEKKTIVLNQELVLNYEQKIKDRIAKVWEE